MTEGKGMELSMVAYPALMSNPLDSTRISADLLDLSTHLRDVAMKIHASPELRFEEHKAMAWLADLIEREGIAVERGTGGLPTAFRAEVGKGRGPKVAILSEYDALPEIGHACGHNLIAAGGVGAFLALARQRDAIEGTVTILGTPAEEGGGGKITLIDAGAFEGVDAAMMFHPFDRDLMAHIALANIWIEARFSGKPSHAAIAPWDGRSALTACMDMFRLIDGQRVHFRDGVRVHGFIREGGVAANIIPERAIAEFSVRALDTTELARVKAIVERCARAAAMASDVTVELTEKPGYKNMVNNMTMARRFGAHLASLGRPIAERDVDVGAGSTDMGDVSHVVPSIHPYVAICDRGESTCHQHAFAACAASERGMRAMLDAAEAMAKTAAELLTNEALLAQVKAERAQAG